MILDMGEIRVLGSLGERVRALRIAKGLDQIQLARAVSGRGTPVKNATISAIERGEINPSLPVVINIADELGVSLDYITMRTDVAETPAAMDEPVYFSPEADEVARLVDGMPEHLRREVLAHVQLIMERTQQSVADVQPAVDAFVLQLKAANLVLDEPALNAVRALVRRTFGVDIVLPTVGAAGRRDRAR